MSRIHHTKQKADVGLAKVIADLVSKGHTPCLPLSEHQPFDLVVVLKSGEAIKVQVKFSRLKESGVVDVKCRTSWADKNGNHETWYTTEDFDYFAIYCPEKECVLYIPNTDTVPRSVRFNRTANNQKKHVKWASSYLNI